MPATSMPRSWSRSDQHTPPRGTTPPGPDIQGRVEPRGASNKSGSNTPARAKGPTAFSTRRTSPCHRQSTRSDRPRPTAGSICWPPSTSRSQPARCSGTWEPNGAGKTTTIRQFGRCCPGGSWGSSSRRHRPWWIATSHGSRCAGCVRILVHSNRPVPIWAVTNLLPPQSSISSTPSDFQAPSAQTIYVSRRLTSRQSWAGTRTREGTARSHRA